MAMTSNIVLTRLPLLTSLAHQYPTLPITLKHRSGGRNENCRRRGDVRRVAAGQSVGSRRSANYQPSVWDYHLIRSLPVDSNDEKNQIKKVERLKEEAKSLFGGEMDSLAKLELIDSIQRLGLDYHFEEEIKTTLNNIKKYQEVTDASSWMDEDLYATALKFRLFRQNGFNVSQDVFKKFKDYKEGKPREALDEHVKTLLSLYEASFLAYEDEATLHEIKIYATKYLTDLVQKHPLSKVWASKIEHALDIPLHWSLNRFEAKWFMDIYEQEDDVNPTLLELAKLDFNFLQSTYLQEVQELTRWWVDMGLNKITFSRDRVLEHYLWCCSMLHEPQFGAFRKFETKMTCFISLIDDVYDLYGSLEEIELFTDFVNRWDISRVVELPPPMRIILLGMYNTANEIGYMSMKDQGFNSIPYISKAWADLCNGYLEEAKWYHGGYIPTLEQYMNNSVVTIASPLMFVIAHILTAEKITTEALNFIQDLPTIVRCSAKISRLANDLGTSKDELSRGDTKKSVQCLMKEVRVGEEEAREHIKALIESTWRTMNNATVGGDYPLSEAMLRATLNLARAAHQYFYKNGDGHGVNPEHETKDHLTSLLVKPVPYN